VARAGVSFEVRRGTDIGEADWDHFYRCYTRTYAEHHSTPYLTRDFFRLTALALPGLWTLVLAWRKGERVAASLLAVDDPSRTVYGRYWGTLEDIPHLHFAACYHEPLDWCIRQGMRRFEGGAQGEHKMARGLLPQPTWSAHWLADAGFSAAVERFLERERAGIADYMEELGQRSPYRRGESPG
jgi:predicted N-acyltransferase